MLLPLPSASLSLVSSSSESLANSLLVNTIFETTNLYSNTNNMILFGNAIDPTPLYMSCVAGLSTGLGAAVVFLQPTTIGEDGKKMKSIGPSQMCFSLALAGSVMITVSVVSILPECLRDNTIHENDPFQMIPILSLLFAQRVFFFTIGCTLYLLLSKLAFPEPNEILGFEGVPITVPSSEQQTLTSMDKDSTHVNNTKNDIERQMNTTPTETNTENNRSSPPSRKLKPKRQMVQKQWQKERKPSLIKDLSGSSDSLEGDSSPSPASSGSSMSLQEMNRGDNNNNKNNTNYLLKAISKFSSGSDLTSHEARRAWRVAMLLFVSLAFHNFPEGLAVAASAMESKKLGLTVMIGIMIHNIPEGIAIAIPCLAARPDKPGLAFWLATISGLAEPLGAFVALLFLTNTVDRVGQPEQTLLNIENVLAFVAGIMIMVAVAELFPESLRYTKAGNRMSCISGTLTGVLIMLATELYLPT